MNEIAVVLPLIDEDLSNQFGLTAEWHLTLRGEAQPDDIGTEVWGWLPTNVLEQTQADHSPLIKWMLTVYSSHLITLASQRCRVLTLEQPNDSAANVRKALAKLREVASPTAFKWLRLTALLTEGGWAAACSYSSVDDKTIRRGRVVMMNHAMNTQILEALCKEECPCS